MYVDVQIYRYIYISRYIYIYTDHITLHHIISYHITNMCLGSMSLYVCMYVCMCVCTHTYRCMCMCVNIDRYNAHRISCLNGPYPVTKHAGATVRHMANQKQTVNKLMLIKQLCFLSWSGQGVRLSSSVAWAPHRHMLILIYRYTYLSMRNP